MRSVSQSDGNNNATVRTKKRSIKLNRLAKQSIKIFEHCEEMRYISLDFGSGLMSGLTDGEEDVWGATHVPGFLPIYMYNLYMQSISIRFNITRKSTADTATTEEM